MKKYIAFFVVLSSLSACDGGVKETLGLKQEAPDEFSVISRPPLSVPKEFSLRPPATAGEAANFGASAEEKARQVINGTAAEQLNIPSDSPFLDSSTATPQVFSSPLESKGEANLLQNAGANKANPQIREVLQKETPRIDTDEKPSLIEKLNPKKPEPVVDAKAEAERLKDNKAKNKPSTEGKTPETAPAGSSVWDRLFN